MQGLGLVGYGSSDEEDSHSEQPIKIVESRKPDTQIAQSTTPVDNHKGDTELDDASLITTRNEGSKQAPPKEAINGSIEPLIGPSRPLDLEQNISEDKDAGSMSPYTANQTAIRELTLPPFPNFNIPPSPPGSPLESTVAKFANFRKLKAEGNHFNERLAQSPALKNPAFGQRLMEFAGISQQDQYATTLPKDLWDPAGFPKWAYKEELAQNQRDITRRREEERMKKQRDAIDFVPAAGSGGSSRSGTPGRRTAQSTAERIRAGLDRREKSHSPLVLDRGAKNREEERKTRFDDSRQRTRSQSRE